MVGGFRRNCQFLAAALVDLSTGTLDLPDILILLWAL